jgi:antitoxin component of MazEF toxin-antitoxin module
MTAKTKRRLIQIGHSQALTLPAHWIAGMNLQTGDVLTVLYDTEVRIIAPPKKTQP